jgi:hypothetical protein
MVLSFVDRDMIMRYFEGGIGHVDNSPRHQVDSESPYIGESEELEMEISDANNLNAFGPGLGEANDIIMDYELENDDDDEESDEHGTGSDSTELDSDEDSHGDDGLGEDANDDPDDDGYGSF